METRSQYREALASLAATTREKLPQLNGRVEKAVTLVLKGDVTLQDDGGATVGSLSDPLKKYQVLKGECGCRDWPQAPEHLCAHRLAAGFSRKLATRVPPVPPHEAASLGEAPASCNVRAQVGQYEIQFTLRGMDETVLLGRLQALLKRPELRPMPYSIRQTRPGKARRANARAAAAPKVSWRRWQTSCSLFWSIRRRIRCKRCTAYNSG